MSVVRLTVFTGWISGLLPLDRPWGTIRFSSWLSFSGLLSVSTLLILVFLIADISLHDTDFTSDTELTKLGKYLNDIASTHRMIFYVITRFTFLCHAKKFADTFGKLDTYPTKKDNILRKSLKVFDSIIILLSFTCGIGNTIIGTTILVGMLQQVGGNFLMNNLGSVSYSILLAAFGTLPICLCDTIAFALIVTAVRGLLRIFNEFCEDFEALILGDPDTSLNNLPAMLIKKQSLHSTGNLVDLENEFRRFVEITPQERKKSVSKMGLNLPLNPQNAARQEMLTKFYRMVDMGEGIRNVTSPFVFVICMVTTVELVAAASGIAVLGHRGQFLVMDALALITVLVHLCLLQVGHRVQVTVMLDFTYLANTGNALIFVFSI